MKATQERMTPRIELVSVSTLNAAHRRPLEAWIVLEGCRCEWCQGAVRADAIAKDDPDYQEEWEDEDSLPRFLEGDSAVCVDCGLIHLIEGSSEEVLSLGGVEEVDTVRFLETHPPSPAFLRWLGGEA